MKRFLIGVALSVIGATAIAQTPQAVPAPAPMAQHRMMMNQVQTRDGVVAMVRDHFARLDTNRDGVLTQDEMKAQRGMRGKGMAMRGRGKERAQRDHGAMFARMDTNKDGMISRQEFDAAHAKRADHRMAMRGGHEGAGMHRMGAGMHHMGGGMFGMADADKDGRVTLAEAQAAALRHFDMMDVNRDGQVTPDERRNMRQQMRAQRAPRAG